MRPCSSMFIWLFMLSCTCVYAQNEGQSHDAFDVVRLKMNKVNAENCHNEHTDDLYLYEDTLSHLPDIKDIPIDPVFPNRTALLHLHNMAINRAFFWSYALQSRYMRPMINDTYDPGMMYYFLSTLADVSANPHINASAIYFSPNSSYTSSYQGFFNKTMLLFAPRTYRASDLHQPSPNHLENISARNTFVVKDIGAISEESRSADYTSDYYRINEWYKQWLPDVDRKRDTKTTYLAEIRSADNTTKSFIFYGPPGGDEVPGPVKWTRPYFDCGRSNRWLVSAVVPIADIYPRHTQTHAEYPTYTAIAVLEMDFDQIDINQCPKGNGNSGPNRFADTARCKKETTECEPLHGWGFRRGGYQCRCKPGWRRPNNVSRPYLGEILESSSAEQYDNGYDCIQIKNLQPVPYFWNRAPPEVRQKYLDEFSEYRNASVGRSSLYSGKINIDEALKFMDGVNGTTCKNFPAEDLILRDIGFGAEEQFANEARMAVRLANFISAFLQVSDPNKVYSEMRVADKPLSEDQIIGETLALVLGDLKIWSAGTFWERNKFANRTLFAPFAYRRELLSRKFYVEDVARLNKTEEVYTNKEWFKILKQRWSSNVDSLEMFFMGEYWSKYGDNANSYRAANIDHGHWTPAYFDCDRKIKKWVITYASPFFGWDSLKMNIEFKGVVAVTMDLLNLDINQCPDNSDVPNVFKDTHKCDKQTSYCVPISGRLFETGGYKCECKQGYEYPSEELITYFDGQLVESEFHYLVEDKETRYHTFKCRLPEQPLPLPKS